MMRPEADDAVGTAELPASDAPFQLIASTDADAGYCADGVCVVPGTGPRVP